MSYNGQKAKKMKKVLFLFVFTLGFVLSGTAQPPHYDDLVIYYADGDYEKLLKVAEKYTLKDDTKKDAIPYLYLSKANYAMSKDSRYDEDYPKAFKDALKYGSKCRRYDTDGTVYSEHIAFFTDLKKACVELIKNDLADGNYSRLNGDIAMLHRIAFDDVGSWFLKVAVHIRNKEKSEVKEFTEKANENLDAVTSVDAWQPVDFEMLKIGTFEYCKAIDEVYRQKNLGTELLGKVKQWFEGDDEFMKFYNCYVNGQC